MYFHQVQNYASDNPANQPLGIGHRTRILNSGILLLFWAGKFFVGYVVFLCIAGHLEAPLSFTY